MKIFLWLFLLILSESKSYYLIEHKSFRLVSISGQLSAKVKKELNTKYWKFLQAKSKAVEIKYEIFEFLDFIYVKGTLKIGPKTRVFRIRHEYSNKVDWKHDSSLVSKIAHTIHIQSQILASL